MVFWLDASSLIVSLTCCTSRPPLSLVSACQTSYPCLAAEPGSEKSPVRGRDAPIVRSPPPEALSPLSLELPPQAASPRDITAARATACQPRRIETWDMLPPRWGRNQLRRRQSCDCHHTCQALRGKSLPERATTGRPAVRPAPHGLQTFVVI